MFKSIIAFLKLVRIQNLIIIAFTQYMVRWCLIYPILKMQSDFFQFQLSNVDFFLLVLSTVMIAAAGYVINDYFDVKMDKVNKPDKLIIGKGVKRLVAIGAHTVINIIAILIGGYVSYKIGLWKLVFIHIICATGLWFYSTTFKRQFFIGNIVISAFTVMVPLVVGIFDIVPCYREYVFYNPDLSFINIWKWVLGIAFFAGITTLLREIIKDIEDYEGDIEYGCNTLPIALGKTTAKAIVITFTLATMCCLAFLQLRVPILQWGSNNGTSFWYVTVAIQLPLAYLITKVFAAQTKKDYRFAGNTAKFIMLTGVCYLFIFSYFIRHF